MPTFGLGFCFNPNVCIFCEKTMFTSTLTLFPLFLNCAVCWEQRMHHRTSPLFAPHHPHWHLSNVFHIDILNHNSKFSLSTKINMQERKSTHFFGGDLNYIGDIQEKY